MTSAYSPEGAQGAQACALRSSCVPRDFDQIPGQRDGWSRYISATVERAIANVRRQGVAASGVQFYNETKRSSDPPITDRAIQWLGFPRTLVAQFGRSRALRVADDPAPDPQINNILSRRQDEYLEWQVTRRAGKIVRVTFTCEGPEYWQSIAGGPSFYNGQGQSPADFGATGDRQLLVRLYRMLLGTIRSTKRTCSSLRVPIRTTRGTSGTPSAGLFTCSRSTTRWVPRSTSAPTGACCATSGGR